MLHLLGWPDRVTQTYCWPQQEPWIYASPRVTASALKPAAAVVPARVDAELICTGLGFNNL